MNLGSLTAWFVVVGCLSAMVIYKYNNRLAEAHFVDELECVLSTNRACWEDNQTRLLASGWERDDMAMASGRIKIKIQAKRRTDNLSATDLRIFLHLGGKEDNGKFVFERLANPQYLKMHSRSFRYFLSGGYADI